MRYGLKERLLGAAVLMAAIAVFMPFLLEEKRPEIPIADKIITPEPPQPVKSSVEQPKPPQLPNSLTEQQKQQVIVDNKVLVDSGLKLNPEGGVDAWTIQVATFGDNENAKRLVDELKKQQYHAYWRKINSLTVVFVGPYIDQQQGREDQDKLLQVQGFKTLLTRYVSEYEAKVQDSLPTMSD